MFKLPPFGFVGNGFIYIMYLYISRALVSLSHWKIVVSLPPSVGDLNAGLSFLSLDLGLTMSQSPKSIDDCHTCIGIRTREEMVPLSP